jgi:hypothetical protein
MKSLFLGFAVVALTTQMASAALSMRFTAGNPAGGPTVVVDCVGGACNVPGQDQNGALGQMNVSLSIGAWTVNIVGAFSQGPSIVNMDLSSFNATAAGASTLKIELSETSLNVPVPAFSVVGSGHIVQGSGSADIFGRFDNTNAAFGGVNNHIAGPFTSAYTFSGGFNGPGVPLYSVTEEIDLTSGPNGVQWSTDTSLTSVPEPGAVMLLGTALVFCSSRLRRKKA